MSARDPLDGRVARTAPPALAPYVDAGVLDAADVHVATALDRLTGGAASGPALLAAALAVRAPRLGHVCVDLTATGTTVGADAEDATAQPEWPPPDAWLDAVRRWDAVDVDGTGGPDRPLRLEGTRLYLDRHWADERDVADALDRRVRETTELDPSVLASPLAALFPDDGSGDQRAAAATAALRRLTVVAGGPGTGKTTTVGRILALLDGLDPLRPGRVALAAPTGKAAARLHEAVHETLATTALDPAARERLAAVPSSTLHRLLGWQPGNATRFRHHRHNLLPHSLVVVDEASMVSLSLMARLLEALRPDARLVLVGDPAQLVSVEAGAVLGDIVGPARRRPVLRDAARASLARALGAEPDADVGHAAIGDGIALLRRTHRFGGTIAELAEAIRLGDAPRTLAALGAGRADVEWVDADPANAAPPSLRARVTEHGRALIAPALAGDARAALAALGDFRLLVAHRRGTYGVERWNALAERWLEDDGVVPGEWSPGRPALVTANDPSLRLYNGDTGVVVARGDDPPAVAFPRDGAVVYVSPARLGDVTPVHAMTIHKSQGSQFGTVAVLLPPATSPILTRELLYTAVTRARTRLIVVGTADAVRGAVDRPVARASGLGDALWGARPGH